MADHSRIIFLQLCAVICAIAKLQCTSTVTVSCVVVVNKPGCSWYSHTGLLSYSWANQDEVWRNMLHKDRIYPRDKNLFQKHPELQQSMRAILLDWLMEVSGVTIWKLHTGAWSIVVAY